MNLERSLQAVQGMTRYKIVKVTAWEQIKCTVTDFLLN